MRKPTPLEVQLAWHRAALAGQNLPLHPDDPEVGWYRTRLIKGGPWVPARIWLYSPVDENGDLIGDEVLQAELNGSPADPYDSWVWWCYQPISEADWRYLEDLRLWAKANNPTDPAARPFDKIDPLTAPIPF